MKLNDDTEIKAYVRRRDEALRILDITWARSMLPSVVSDEALLMALHKTRYNAPAIEEKLRLESGEWLRSRGFSDVGGMPLLPPGQLP